MPSPAASVRPLTASARCRAGVTSTTSAVATPAVTVSKQTPTRRVPASQASEGASALARSISEKASTAPASTRLRPATSASAARGSAPSAPRASTEPRSESAGT